MIAPDDAWSQWFDVQYDLCREVAELIDAAGTGKSPGFAVALHSAVIEHLAERMRHRVELRQSDEPKS